MKLPYSIVLHPDPICIYAAEIPDLPGCISQGETVQEPFEMIEGAKLCWLEAALEDGIEIPEPVTEEYSEKCNVRIPKTLHRSLAEKAREEKSALIRVLLISWPVVWVIRNDIAK